MSPDGVCGVCEIGEANAPHPCPFLEDVGDDSETLCNCCDDCMHQCATDI